jgi:hypothetical protein
LKALKPHTKPLAILIVLIAVAGLLAYPLVQFWAPLKPVVRHVNPAAEAEQPPLPAFLALLATNAFDSLISRDYGAVAEGLKTLGAIQIPERYKFIANRFMQLLNDTSRLLNETEGLLDQAEADIKLGRGEDAKPLLHQASARLASANATRIELRSASEELARTFLLPADQLRHRVDELGRVIAELHWRLLGLLEMIERQTMLEDTYLIIDVTPKTVWTGGSIEVSGQLYTSKAGLSGRSVQIYADGRWMAEAVTGDNGEFHASVNLPYIYKPKIPIEARYLPKGPDSEAHKPSTSNTVEIGLLYLRPSIKVEMVGKALPGKTFIIKGYVEAERPLPYSAVKISWLGGSLTASLEEGRFNATLHTPEDALEGEYTLKVEAPPWQIFAPADATIQVTVQRLPLNVTLQPPLIVFAGLPSNLNGKIIYNQEEFNITVRAIFVGQAYTVRSSGEFSLDLSVPLTVFSGYQDYEVHVYPDLPWYRSAGLRGSLLVVNPLTITVPLGLVSALALRLPRGRKVEAAELEEGLRGREAQPQAPVKAYFAASGLQWLIDLYWQAVVIVIRLTGVDMKPPMTMREYLQAVSSSLGGLRAAFEALTLAAEKALYAPTVSAEEAESAKKALEKLKRAHVEVQL